MEFCPECGKIIKSEHEFCVGCGNAIKRNAAQQSDINPLKWRDAIIPLSIYLAIFIVLGFFYYLIQKNYHLILDISLYFLSLLTIYFYLKLRKLNFVQLKLSNFSQKFVTYAISAVVLIQLIDGIWIFFFSFKAPRNFKFISASTMTPLSILLMSLVVIILGPLIEEIIFRGFMFNYLDKKFGFWVGATVSSLLFALIHRDIHYFVIYAISGFIFAYMVKRFSSLWASIISHSLLNAVAYLFILLVTFVQSRTGQDLVKLMSS